MWFKHHGGQVESALSQQSQSASLAKQKNTLCQNSSTQSFVVGPEAAVRFQEQNDSSSNFIGKQTWLNIWQISEDKKTGKTKRGIPGKLCRLVRHACEHEGREGGRGEGEGSQEYSDRAWDLSVGLYNAQSSHQPTPTFLVSYPKLLLQDPLPQDRAPYSP